MLIDMKQATLMLFNMQLNLIPLLHKNYELTHGCQWLADLFSTHDLPTVLIEHKKLGQLAPSIKTVAKNASIFEKYHFSVTKEAHIMSYLSSLNRKQLILAGAESHVCLFQSAVLLKKEGFEVFVLSDTTSARNVHDHEAALQRLHDHGCQLITKEMLFFELIDHSELPNYLDLALKFLDGRYIQ